MSTEQKPQRPAGAMTEEHLLAAWEIRAAAGDPCAQVRVEVLRERIRENHA